MLRLHIHMNFLGFLWMLNLEADELMHPNRKPKKKVARRQGSPPSRMLFWQGSGGNLLIFPWMIMPKPCAKRSKMEEVVERNSLSWLFEGCIPKKRRRCWRSRVFRPVLLGSVARLFWYYFGDYFVAGVEIVPQKGLCNRNKTSALVLFFVRSSHGVVTCDHIHAHG